MPDEADHSLRGLTHVEELIDRGPLPEHLPVAAEDAPYVPPVPAPVELPVQSGRIGAVDGIARRVGVDVQPPASPIGSGFRNRPTSGS